MFGIFSLKIHYVSFDVVSLFLRITIRESLDLISKLLDPKTLEITKIICLTTTFFIFKDKLYAQTKDTKIGSSLYLVVENIFLEHFKTLSPNSFHLKPKSWFCFIYMTALSFDPMASHPLFHCFITSIACLPTLNLPWKHNKIS